MTGELLKLTVYFGERDRAGGGFLADELIGVYARARVAASVLLRGTEGFGIRHQLQTQRLLTLSEDLPLVSVAVDERERIEALLPEVSAVCGHGLVTLERARAAAPLELPAGEQAKLTLYLGRGSRPGPRAVVELLRRHGVAGATALLGVDGTVRGKRRRARFVGRNAQVPAMVVSVGDGERIAAALAEVARVAGPPLATLERVRVLRRDGTRLAEAPSVPPADPSGLAVWQKVSVYASEQARAGRRPLYAELVRRLRAEGAAGATALRGVWGYHGDHEPHGERLLSLRRHLPVVTVAVDEPERARRWLAVVDELTRETGLVTSELVPAFRASAPGIERGGLRVSSPHA
ncbi:MAG: DUF190 domain-containing protein [Thermoleophilaceae bacterium]|nr:DUF190 domain-containing protein [Thermoleophilaceae bacterium]